jgi:hypothetical protein
MRLGWIERLYDITEQSITIPIKTYSDVDRWYRDLTHSLHQMSDLHRIILPIPGTYLLAHALGLYFFPME